MAKIDLEVLTEEDEKLRQLLKGMPGKLVRKVERLAWTNFCCGERMVRLSQYEQTRGERGTIHEIKLRAIMYYCPECGDWYEI